MSFCYGLISPLNLPPFHPAANFQEAALARISRNDLDVLSTLEKFKHWLTGDYFSQTTHQRWEHMRNKPRTFAKILVLHCLEHYLTSDEQINGAYYRLVDVVEPFVTSLFSGATHDILPRADYEALREASALPLDIAYEPFRALLMKTIQEYLLEGINLRQTFRSLSEHLNRTAGRPLLLIDDLVQSINVFASDFLDYFTTLEDGNWDVIIGLTPAAMQSDARGREILERINHLDTFDDRVEKLWLSDDQGRESYILDEQNLAAFAFPYLQAFRAAAGVTCERCPMRVRCTALAGEDRQILAPFNTDALRRLYRGTPPGKGKPRYFLRSLKGALSAMIDGQPFSEAVGAFAQADSAVESDFPALTALATWYAPATDTPQKIKLPAGWYQFFGLPEYPVHTHPLMPQTETNLNTALPTSTVSSTPSVEVIAHWLDERPVNRQLMQGLRKGTAHWIHAIFMPESIHRVHIAKPSSILQYKRVAMGVSPAIQIENIDELSGIFIGRTLGHAAFLLESYGRSSGSQARQMAEQLLADPRSVSLLWEAERAQEAGRQLVEQQLGHSLDEVALSAYAVVCIVAGIPMPRPPGFGETFWLQTEELHQRAVMIPQLVAEHLKKDFTALFADCFRLREHIFDGVRIATCLGDRSPVELLISVRDLPVDSLDSDFKLGQALFRDQLMVLCQVAQRCIDLLNSPAIPKHVKLSKKERQILQKVLTGQTVSLHQLQAPLLDQLRDTWSELYDRLLISIEKS